jgi:hypothetical protein
VPEPGFLDGPLQRTLRMAGSVCSDQDSWHVSLLLLVVPCGTF